ncbi:MAG: cobalamin biosynthesis protein CobQ [Pseudomonadota bacterium]
MAALGSLLPDLSLYVLAGVSLFLLRISPERVFSELYFSPAWQSVFSIDNSLVIWGLGFLLALTLQSTPWMAFSTAGLLHIASDMALHNDDARPHFWPITDWVFESPISYWDSQHHAALVAPFTVLAMLLSAYVIWQRWPKMSIRGAVLAACCLELWVVRQWLVFF